MEESKKTDESKLYPMPDDIRGGLYNHLTSKGFDYKSCGIDIFDEGEQCGILKPWEENLKVKPGSRLETEVDVFLAQLSASEEGSTE